MKWVGLKPFNFFIFNNTSDEENMLIEVTHFYQQMCSTSIRFYIFYIRTKLKNQNYFSCYGDG